MNVWNGVGQVGFYTKTKWCSWFLYKDNDVESIFIKKKTKKKMIIKIMYWIINSWRIAWSSVQTSVLTIWGWFKRSSTQIARLNWKGWWSNQLKRLMIESTDPIQFSKHWFLPINYTINTIFNNQLPDKQWFDIIDMKNWFSFINYKKLS